ncbi:hypothetical protein [Chryseobacterium sp.]|uniref:hypothetical protein n=1 Tax=Chryseobacterium sp. TaxID=1871047 RepID=UPI0011CA36F4|nr:hypothetical protein [Chryseobacterium sp.]TXF76337.1 hypothetical protein FUA25_10660 [Chryseobacterium sp.]
MKNIVYSVLLLILGSCASEKLNMSPLNNNGTTSKTTAIKDFDTFNNYITQNENAAEITNLLSSFPKFSKNKSLNLEAAAMIVNIQDYLYAVEAGNAPGKERALKGFEKSYKKVQTLRKKLSPDEDKILNRYLVRIKTNINSIEYYLHTPVNN